MFKAEIENRTFYTLFDTGATRSVMSTDTFKILKLRDEDLDTTNIPVVVGANGTSLGAIGQITCELQIGHRTCKQKFLVCQGLKRNIILGVDFAKKYAAGVHWTKQNSFVLTIDGKKAAETKELHQHASVSLKRRTKLPPRSCAIVDVDINTDSTDKVQIIPDEYCLAKNPNMYIYKLHADLKDRKEDSVCPFIMVNLSNEQHIKLPKNHVVAFARKDDTQGEVFQISQLDTTPRHWIPQQSERSLAGVTDRIMNDLRLERPVARIAKESTFQIKPQQPERSLAGITDRIMSDLQLERPVAKSATESTIPNESQ